MEWQLLEDRKAQYDQLIRSAQELETNIGASQYRIYKLDKMREDIDTSLKMWWDQVLKDLSLDPKKDYMITLDGKIQDVSKPTDATIVESNVGSNASELV